MISIIFGPKGTGKTKIIMDQVNAAAKLDSRKGDVVFISKDKIQSSNIDFNVRCLFAEQYDVCNEVAFVGFVKGLMAGNADIEYLIIDGLLKILGKGVGDVQYFFKNLKELEEEYGMKIIVSLSASKEEIPEELHQYLA